MCAFQSGELGALSAAAVLVAAATGPDSVRALEEASSALNRRWVKEDTVDRETVDVRSSLAAD